MYDKGFITARALHEAQAEPLLVRGKNYEQSPAPYFVEWVRQYLERNYSKEQIWEGGLKILYHPRLRNTGGSSQDSARRTKEVRQGDQ